MQMKLYGTHDALGKRTLKAAAGREVNLRLMNNAIVNEEGESMYHYNPKHVSKIINIHNATEGGGGGGEEEEEYISRKICSTETEKT